MYMPLTYNQNDISTWSAATTNDFFAFQGTGNLALNDSYGSITGYLQKYETDSAFQMKIPAASLVISGDTATIPVSVFSSLTDADILDLGKIADIYIDFVNECANYFGIAVTTWDNTTTTGLCSMFDTTNANKIIANTDANKKMTKAGFKLIVSSGTPVSGLTISELDKKFASVEKTNVFSNNVAGTPRTVLVGFRAGDLIFFNAGLKVTFTVNLTDGSITNVTNIVDYVNASTVGSDTTYTTGVPTKTTYTVGDYTATTTLVGNVLTKVYIAPLVLKVV